MCHRGDLTRDILVPSHWLKLLSVSQLTTWDNENELILFCAVYYALYVPVTDHECGVTDLVKQEETVNICCQSEVLVFSIKTCWLINCTFQTWRACFCQQFFSILIFSSTKSPADGWEEEKWGWAEGKDRRRKGTEANAIIAINAHIFAQHCLLILQ